MRIFSCCLGSDTSHTWRRRTRRCRRSSHSSRKVWLTEMSSANVLVCALLFVSLRATGWEIEGQNTRVAKPPRRVVNAYCDNVGAHIVYDSGREIVRRARPDERCADMRVSDDRRDVGWLMESEARAE